MMRERLREFQAFIARQARQAPEQAGAFHQLFEAVHKPGALDTKTKELIAVALAVAAHCEWCIAFHVKQALDAGAKPEELMEAAWVAVLMGGGPSLAYTQLVEKAIEEFTSQES
ncbi:carboxymuconolactone decarboxylase family protein [Stetteria hydrogenophila]